MAITLADFTKIWASTSPLTPYSFSESNYKEGWNFIGGTPPSRQMWDFLQNQNDEKLKYIVDNFLPLSGGTMTGAISFDETGQIGYRATTHTEPADPCKQVIVSATDIDHWADEGGAKLSLRTYDTTQTNTYEDGSFGLLATDGTDNKELKGKPDGSLTWAGKDVERVNASGSNYIRYESGLQICWGAVSITPSGGGAPFAHSGNATVTFPVAFSSAPLVFANINDNAGYWNAECQTQSTTGATISIGGYNTNQKYAQYFAIGKWN